MKKTVLFAFAALSLSLSAHAELVCIGESTHFTAEYAGFTDLSQIQMDGEFHVSEPKLVTNSPKSARAKMDEYAFELQDEDTNCSLYLPKNLADFQADGPFKAVLDCSDPGKDFGDEELNCELN